MPASRFRLTLVLVGILLWGPRLVQPQERALSVFNAAALGQPFKEVLGAYAALHPGVETLQENSPSIEAVRKMTELGKIPDVLALADQRLFSLLVVPKYASWYAIFGSNAMVLAYSDRSVGAAEITSANWWRVLLRPGVRTGRSDPGVDPSGYRTLMAVQLAELHYHEPGLGDRLKAAMPTSYVRHAEAELGAMIEAGEFDYAWTYESLAVGHHLRYVSLPPEVNLSDPTLSEWYARAKVRIPQSAGRDSVELSGEPILFGVTIPTRAQHAAEAAAFLRFVFSPAGRQIIERSGFRMLPVFQIRGTSPPEGLGAIRN